MTSVSDRSDSTQPGGPLSGPSRRRSHGGDHRRRWYLLDNTARLFPSIVSPQFPATFRIAAVLDHPINLESLTQALSDTWERIPYFQVRLRRGVFWHYLEECTASPPELDDIVPCTRYPRYRSDVPLARVYTRGRRIAVEASHVLTDGTGALEFLRTLLVAYVARRRSPDTGPPPRDRLFAEARELGIRVPGDAPSPGEAEYASRRFYERRLPYPDEFSPAWHLDGPRLPEGHYHVTTLRYPVADLRNVAQHMGIGLTDLVLAVYVDALQRHYHATQPRRRHRRPIRILIPVNMRPHTPSETMRNFFVYVMVELDQRLGIYSLEEIAHSVHHRLRAELDSRSLRRQITRNVRAERNVFIRIIPIVFKDMILRTVHRLQGEQVNTASFSNLGRVALPGAVADRVVALDFVPPPSPITGVNMTMISTGETAGITFGSTRVSHEIERMVAETFRRLGLRGVLRTNWDR